ncbi:hypothetical protein [Yoonia sp. BS5-3]|uniref:STAS domain-containing protein n=1 Tax=Yoonia phaeophyticola TaxID=3137369 RepID=A0ABZ2V5W3_9RHOB
MTTTSTFELEPQRGKDAPDDLLAFLRDNQGGSVEINLQNVTTLSGPQIELLLIGHRQWQSEGHGFALTDTSPELIARMIGFGLPPQLFSKEIE